MSSQAYHLCMKLLGDENSQTQYRSHYDDATFVFMTRHVATLKSRCSRFDGAIRPITHPSPLLPVFPTRGLEQPPRSRGASNNDLEIMTSLKASANRPSRAESLRRKEENENGFQWPLKNGIGNANLVQRKEEEGTLARQKLKLRCLSLARSLLRVLPFFFVFFSSV